MAQEKSQTLWESVHKGELIRLAAKSYKGRDFLDLRRFYLKDGEWRHGAKGCTLPAELAGDLWNAMGSYLSQSR